MVDKKLRVQPLRWIALAAALLIGGYVLGPPLIAFWNTGSHSPSSTDLRWLLLADQIRIRFFEAVIAIWLFFFGASIGSFLNVVVYRTPRNLSLLGSSFCPKCHHPIRWRNNIPVFGWVGLKGRCRDCSEPISGRYPLIESVTGLMLLGLVLIQLTVSGDNLPDYPPSGHLSLSWLAQQMRWEWLAVLLAQAFLLCVLLTWALIRWDGFRLPRRYVALTLGLGLVLPTVVPILPPASESLVELPWLPDLDGIRRLLAAMLGAVAGGVLGGLQAMVARVWPAGSPGGKGNAWDLVATVALIGALLGWQMTLAAWLLAACFRMIVSVVTGDLFCQRGSSVWVHFVPATFLVIVGGRNWYQWASWPVVPSFRADVVFAIAAGLLFCLIASYVESRPSVVYPEER
jgi:leader peptidase (prepilin peptidase) / N-methyltransferase